MRITRPTERWFPVPNDPDGAKIKIKHLSPGELREIRDNVLQTEIEYIAGKPVVRSKQNLLMDHYKTIQKRVVGWENIFDADGSPLPYTPENVILCSSTIKGFDELIQDLAIQLAEDIEKEAVEQEKN